MSLYDTDTDKLIAHEISLELGDWGPGTGNHASNPTTDSAAWPSLHYYSRTGLT